MSSPILLAVPNVSEGRDAETIEQIGLAFRASKDPMEVRLLDLHTDADHHRSVFTLAGPPRHLADALLRGTACAVERIDVMRRSFGAESELGVHPHVGAVDVVPLVYLEQRTLGAACAEALAVGDRIASELEVPVFIYGELAGGAPGATRAELRRGGVIGLAERLAAGAGPRPTFGPHELHRSAGATLLAAREPLVAFNLELAASQTVADARRVAALIRDGGEHGLPGVRAIGVPLGGDRAQLSMNIEHPLQLPLAELVQAVRRHVPLARAELVGLAPRVALDGFPDDLPLPGFDPERHLIENALGS